MITSTGQSTNWNKRLHLALQFADPMVSPNSGWVAGFYYLRNCLNALAALPDDLVPEVAALVPAGFADRLLFRGSPEPEWLSVIEVGHQQNTGEPIDEIIRSLNADVVFPVTELPTAALPCASIGWIPDFQHKHLPQFFDAQEIENRRLHYGFLAGYCDRLACSSFQVLEDFRATFPDVGNKGELLRFSVTFPSDLISQSPLDVLKRLQLDGRTYAYLPNQFWAHKNHRTVFQAWRTVISERPDLLLVCSGIPHDYRAPDYYAELEEFLKASDLERSVVRLGGLDRGDQLQVMRGAALVIQPSLFEGRSTSVEEAKALGKPLLLSDIPVHREQCGSYAIYFQSLDASELAQKTIECLSHQPAGHDPRREATALARNEHAVRSFGKALLGVAGRARANRTAHHTYWASHQLELSLTLSLNRRLSRAESDSAARLGTIDAVASRLTEVEADRAARLKTINLLTSQLVEVEADRAARLKTINLLTSQLVEAESDRAARLVTINLLTSQLAEAEADRAARLVTINLLTSQSAEAEADRAARLVTINRLTSQLAEAEADRAARLETINRLTSQLAEAEADRSARLDAINILSLRLAEVESDRRASHQTIDNLMAQQSDAGHRKRHPAGES